MSAKRFLASLCVESRASILYTSILYTMRLHLGFLLALMFVQGVLATHSAAQRPDIISKNLIDHWDRSGANRKLQLDLEVEGTERSAYIALSWVVNRINQFAYDQGSDTADQIVLQYPQLLDAWYCKAWLDLREGNIDSGLVTLQSYRENLDKQNLPAADRAIHLRRMGRLCGFADSAASSKATPETLQQTLDLIANNLEDVDLEEFTEQYHASLDTFTKLVEAKEDTAKQAIIVAVNEQKKELADLNAEAIALSEEENELQKAAGEIKVKIDRALSDIDREAAPLQETIGKINYSIDSALRRIADLQHDLFYQQSLADNESDPRLRQIYLNRAANISHSIRDVQYDLNALERDRNSFIGQLQIHENERNRVSAAASQQLGNINRRLNSIGKQMRRNVTMTKRASKSPKPKASVLTSIKNRTRFIGTYDPFPLEAMRQNILKRYE